MKKTTRLLTIFVVVLAMVFVVACGNNNNSSGNDTNNKVEDKAPDNTNKDANNKDGGQQMADGPFGKYDPPITLTTVRGLTPGAEYLPDQTVENNVWTREFASELGINLKYDWLVNSAQYQNKIMVTIVSGDLPDFFEVDMQKFQTLAQAGQLADLTEIYEEYQSDNIRQLHAEQSDIGIKAGTVDGKLLGIATDGGSNDDVPLLYIRDDWLKNLNLEPPKTMDDLINIALAFTNDDPDQNGLDDTHGLALAQNLFGGINALQGFFNGYGAYAFNPANGSGTNLVFLKDADGKAIYADIQPEVKTALGKLAELFAAGAIHPEFSVMDDSKMGEQLTSNKVGMVFGQFWVPTWPINNMAKENPDVEWGVYEVPSNTGSPSLVLSTGIPSKFMVVSKNSKHPEAVIKLYNYATEKLNGPGKDIGKYHTIHQNDQNYQIHTLAPFYKGAPETNQNHFYKVEAAYKSGDTSELDEEQAMYLKQVKDYEDGDPSQFAGYTLWKPDGVFHTLGQYKQGDRILMTAYTGAPTPTMVSRGPSLRDLEVKAFMDIIMGAQPLDYFDTFKQQWLDQGGQDILDEVNSTGQVN